MGMKPEQKTKPLEQRSYDFEVKAEETDTGNIITGRPIVYSSRSNIGCFDEIIEPGALNNTDLTDVRFLVNHDTSKIPLARSRRNNGNSTMQLTTDNDGLRIRVVLDTENNSEARALYSAVQRGDISGMSFMFGVRDDEWEDIGSDHPTRHVKDISTVVEVSAVTFPAYKSTEINARSKEALDNARSTVKAARQQAKTSIDTDLDLEKAKLHTRLLVADAEIRFNKNHGKNGQFTSGGGGGGGSHSGGGSKVKTVADAFKKGKPVDAKTSKV